MLRACSLAFVCALALFACADETAIVVEVTSGDLTVPADVDALRFEVFVDGGGPMADTTVAHPGTWPQSLAVRPGSADSRSPIIVRVTGLAAGSARVRRVVRAIFSPGRVQTIRVDLTRSCLDVACASDLADCVAGMCRGVDPVDAGVDSGRDASPMDAGMDVGPPDGDVGDAEPDTGLPDAGPADTGPADTGPVDTGPPDTGPADTGPPDTGPCVPSGTEICNGLDEDCDGFVDEGLPCLGAIVISEVATGGPSGGLDEFVELYNRTERPVDIAGLTLQYRSATGSTWATRATMPLGAIVPGHGFYLSVGDTYARSPGPDNATRWTSGMAASGGHVRLMDGTNELDLLGWGGANGAEGSPITAVSDDTTMSYERKASATSTAATMAVGGADESLGNGQDTNDNSQDFVRRMAAQPQGTANAAEPPP